MGLSIWEVTYTVCEGAIPNLLSCDYKGDSFSGGSTDKGKARKSQVPLG